MSGATTALGVGRPPIARDEAKGLLGEALAMSAADATLAVLESRDESLTRFANNEIHQNVTGLRHTLTVQAIVGRRSGIASTSRLDSSALRQVADRALALARLSPEDDALPEPAPPAETPEIAGFVPATAACTPEERADAVGPVLDQAAAHGMNAAGALSTSAATLAVASTGGVFAWHADTYARFTCTVRGADSSGWCDRHRRDWRALDVAALGATALEKAERSRAPAEVPPGRYTVVLEAAAAAELVAFLALLGLGAQSEQEGRSFLSGKIGERITGESVDLVDDAFDPRGFGRPFDYEGTPRRRVALIERGIARGVVHDRRTARKAGVASTGHATPPPAVEGPLPFDLVLATGDQGLDQIIAGVERGILVTRFWYNRVVDARRTIVTGMTRDGTFLIEGGRLAGGVRNLRFNESVLDVLARAEAIGRDAEPTYFDYLGNTVVVPALRVRDFHFTGVTRF
ncbi:MAG: TldD/PmbA family protein [Candidatus Eisenbacteria bacterium]|uniref:TldD/PmbA family protein n=1 Tax=Eiseniibacteriota bacterium TaxID=2212470 RepID=A0A9D6QK76_UNCEI|nr:TldD/PmbA family protein [Candidatus Eisenbacteria bacterium]MBI3540020.1 TldD/PmbA family protein [Candidatus Eisenbacteria bacterium]